MITVTYDRLKLARDAQWFVFTMNAIMRPWPLKIRALGIIAIAQLSLDCVSTYWTDYAAQYPWRIASWIPERRMSQGRPAMLVAVGPNGEEI